MELAFETHLRMLKPTICFETPLETIRDHAETYAPSVDPIEALKKIMKAGHLQILLFTFITLFGQD